MNENAPGQGANTTLRIIGVLVVLASAALGFWITSEFGSVWDPMLQRSVANPLAVPLALGVFVQGVVLAALFIALAGMGDNLIAIRRNTAPAVAPSSAADADDSLRKMRCPNCHTVFAPEDPEAERANCPKCSTTLAFAG